MKFDPIKNTLILTAAFLLSFLTIGAAQITSPLRANGKIAFTSDRDGNSEIYLMNADGTAQTRLTNSPDRKDYPTWSPDGRKIAYLNQSGGVFSINLMNADGTNQNEVTRIIPWNPSSPFQLFSLSWSPDGAKIAFQDSTDIFTINTDGSNRVNLTNGQFINTQPAWSPDGSRIAFARSTFSHGFYARLYVMNADGSNASQIASCQGYCETRAPDWSPDGGRIAFTFLGDSDSDPDSISLVNADGSNLQRLFSYGPIMEPKWSPDGTKIVSYSSEYSNIPHQIWVTNRDGSGHRQVTGAVGRNVHPNWQPLAIVNVINIEELYAAANNSQNAGSQIAIAAGVYMLSANEPGGAARPNGGRLELQQDMSLIGVVGDRMAVVIDAMNLPTSSYNSAPPIPLTGAIRMGRGSNSIEWLTARNAVNGNTNIGTDLASTAANIRVAHIASTNSARGLDVRNFGAAMAGRVINAEIVDNDFYNNRIGLQGEALRIVNNGGATGAAISANLSGNRSYSNYLGFIVENNGSSLANISVVSSGDRFFENGLGALVGGGLSAGSNFANGNTVNFTATGTSFEDNNGFSNFDHGGLVIIGGENTSFPNGTSNNTVNVELRACGLRNNQLYDLAAFGARSSPVSAGLSGTNNRVNVRLYSTAVSILATDDSIPDNPVGMNSVGISRPSFDFDHDGRTELSVFRPSSRTWYMQGGLSGFTTMEWGVAGDRMAPADFDGDGKTDIAVFRPSEGRWYIVMSQTGAFQTFNWGQDGDLPLPADHNGDGRADLVVYRESNSTWYMSSVTGGPFGMTQFGSSGDKPQVGDFDGDGRADVAVFRPSNSTWYAIRSTQGFTAQTWGETGDIPAPADYDGDGATDNAVFRPSTGQWFQVRTTDGFATVNWGQAGDIPVAADYDGDGKSDAVVFRPSEGIWYLNQSTAGFLTLPFGQNGDVPTPSAFIY